MTTQEAHTNIFGRALDRVRSAIDELGTSGSVPAGLDLTRIVVEPPRDPAHGDMATNAAMALAKDAGKKPRDLAEALAAALREDARIEQVDIAGPGFINLRLKPDVWFEALRGVLR